MAEGKSSDGATAPAAGSARPSTVVGKATVARASVKPQPPGGNGGGPDGGAATSVLSNGGANQTKPVEPPKNAAPTQQVSAPSAAPSSAPPGQQAGPPQPTHQMSPPPGHQVGGPQPTQQMSGPPATQQMSAPTQQAPSHQAPSHQAPSHQAPNHQAPSHQGSGPPITPSSAPPQNAMHASAPPTVQVSAPPGRASVPTASGAASVGTPHVTSAPPMSTPSSGGPVGTARVGAAAGSASVGAPVSSPPGAAPRVQVSDAVRSARQTVTAAASRGPRRARLQLKKVDPWSMMKFSFAVSLVLFIASVVATAILYMVLDALGVWNSLNDSISTLGAGQDGGQGVDFAVTAKLVIGGSALLGAVNMVLFTALATLGAFIYNVCADLVGGIELTLAERD